MHGEENEDAKMNINEHWVSSLEIGVIFWEILSHDTLCPLDHCDLLEVLRNKQQSRLFLMALQNNSCLTHLRHYPPKLLELQLEKWYDHLWFIINVNEVKSYKNE